MDAMIFFAATMSWMFLLFYLFAFLACIILGISTLVPRRENIKVYNEGGDNA